MEIYICVGSSCHLKGSYDVIQKLKALVQKHKLQHVIELKASFCLGHCSRGVTMKVGDDFYLDVNADNIEDVFEKQIMPLLK